MLQRTMYYNYYFHILIRIKYLKSIKHQPQVLLFFDNKLNTVIMNVFPMTIMSLTTNGTHGIIFGNKQRTDNTRFGILRW